jgi:hypothetical protein
MPPTRRCLNSRRHDRVPPVCEHDDIAGLEVRRGSRSERSRGTCAPRSRVRQRGWFVRPVAERNSEAASPTRSGNVVRLRNRVGEELHKVVVRVLEEVGIGDVAELMRPKHVDAVASDVVSRVLQLVRRNLEGVVDWPPTLTSGRGGLVLEQQRPLVDA